MIRITRGKVALKRKKKYFRWVRGYTRAHSRLFTMMIEQVNQSLRFAYIGRKLKKRNFKRLWIHRINALCHLLGTNYSNFIGTLRKKKILVNRKILAFLASQDYPIFKLLVRNFCPLNPNLNL